MLLTGMGHDGADALEAVLSHGGITIVQSPSESKYPQMPLSALKEISPDYQLALGEIAPTIADLCRRRGLRGLGKNHFVRFQLPRMRRLPLGSQR